MWLTISRTATGRRPPWFAEATSSSRSGPAALSGRRTTDPRRLEAEFGEEWVEILRIVGEVRRETLAALPSFRERAARWHEALDLDEAAELVRGEGRRARRAPPGSAAPGGAGLVTGRVSSSVPGRAIPS